MQKLRVPNNVFSDMGKLPHQAPFLKTLTDKDWLASHFGSFDSLAIHPIETRGYSGAKFLRVVLNTDSRNRQCFILKLVDLKDDWFSHRTGDRLGREAKTLLEPKLESLHKIFYTPYCIIAQESQHYGLLMEDLSDGLFPDGRVPLQIDDQDQIIDSMAQLHANYWEAPDLTDLDWLLDPAGCIYQMGPLELIDFDGGSARNVQDQIKAGWDAAMTLLPDHLKDILLLPPEKIISSWADLPKTFIHGDTKVANFAKTADGRLCLLDWAFAGYAPSTFDIGWFIAVNANRLADSKEVILKKYRGRLEHHLGFALDNHLWERMEEAGIVCGTFMLLWSKALGVINNREGGRKEWDWWMQRLEPWAKATTIS